MTHPAQRMMDDWWAALRANVREGRVTRGWSQGELARRAGLSSRVVITFEKGAKCTLDSLMRIALAFGRSPDVFFHPRYWEMHKAQGGIDPNWGAAARADGDDRYSFNGGRS